MLCMHPNTELRIEERTHRLAEEQRAKGKPTISRYLTKEQFLDRAAELGWVYDDDFFGTVYDELSEVPDGKALLIDMMNIPAWDAATQKKHYVVKNYDDDFIVEGSEVIEYLNTDGVQETEKFDDFEVENEDLIEEETPILTAESTGDNTNDPEKSEIKKEGIIPPAEAENK